VNASLNAIDTLYDAGFQAEAKELLLAERETCLEFGDVDNLASFSILCSQMNLQGDAILGIDKAWKLSNEREKDVASDTWVKLSRAVTLTGRVDEGEQCLERALISASRHDGFMQSIYYRYVAEAWLERGELERARLVIKNANKIDKDHVLSGVCRASIIKRRLQETELLLQDMTSGEARCDVEIQLALASFQSGQRGRSFEWLALARRDADQIESAYDRASYLRGIWEALFRCDRAEEGALLLDEIVATGERIEWRERSRHWMDGERVVFNQSGLASTLIVIGDRRKALEVVESGLSMTRRIEAEHARSISLIRWAELYRKLGKEKTAAQILEEAVAASRRIPNEAEKSRAFSRIGKAWAALGRFRAAERMCDLCDPVHRLEGYTYIVNQDWKRRTGGELTELEEDVERAD
jgi:tetratricopeptide (TPR) repeat protein